MATKNNYDENSVDVLKDFDHVRRFAGMYTHTENPLHIITEVIDNACDEANNGFCTNIDATLHEDGSVSIEDNGRGIPVGINKKVNRPTIELVFTNLRAGSKFTKGKDNAYSFSGGLHGVGISVTNALSKKIDVTVWRDKQVHHIAFKDGLVSSPLSSKPLGRNDKKSGTLVRVWPDGKYFSDEQVPLPDLKRLLQSKAILQSKLCVTLTVEKTQEKLVWEYKNGLSDYLSQALNLDSFDTNSFIPIFESSQYIGEGDETFAEGEGASFVVAFTSEGKLIRDSFVNLIPTSAGGTHENGLRDGLFQAVKSFAEMHSLLPKGIRLLPEDVFARASFILSTRIQNPQFQGQTKERLNTRDAVRLVSNCVKSNFETWLHQNNEYGRLLTEWAIRQAQQRAKQSQKIEKKKSSTVAVLPGKLTDCESRDISRNELFLVEGDSAGGSAKMGRNKEFQAILPLRGKVLNSWETDPDRLFANQEIHDISVAIGINPHTSKDNIDLSNLRYGKICVLSDADVDGSHIQVLLLTLFLKHFPKLIEGGHIYVARPPLYRIDAPAKGKRPMSKHYALDDNELNFTLEKLQKDGFKRESLGISRFKGLGEMNAEQLWETTLNPDTRRLLPIVFGPLSQQDTESRFNMLMGKSEAASRRRWMEEHGNEADTDI